jgi:3-methyladenine DNA glycosylase AlkD
MDTKTETEYFRHQIEEHADTKYEAVIRKSIPSDLKVHGLRVFEIRPIVRAWRRAHKDVACEDLVALAEALWDGPSREERMVALELLQHYPRCITSLARSRFEGWRQDLDNWELTDVLGRGVLGPWVLADADERVQYLWDLIGEKDIWSRRLGLVGAIGMNAARKDIGFPDLTLELVDQVKGERDPMITKAVSWMLRDLSTKHPDQVATYLNSNRDALAGHVVREVDNKLKTGLKSGKRKRGGSH